ncbi:GNAT family N-acetyltransferase [Microbacteriaceae bacterium 4G12]
MYIETKHLYMIPFTLELVEATILGKSVLEQHIPYKVSTEWPLPDYAEVLPFKIERLQKQPDRSKWSRLIIHKQDGLIIGDIGFKGGPNEAGTVDIGYSIVPSYRKKGYATESVESMIAWALSQAEVKRVTADCLEHNLASIRVLQKAGMKEVSRMSGMIYWSKEA